MENSLRFPFHIPDIPVLRTKAWQPSVFVGALWSRMSGTTKAILNRAHGVYASEYDVFREARTPLYEVGFGLNGLFGLLRMDFAWRCGQYRQGRDVTVAFSIDGL